MATTPGRSGNHGPATRSGRSRGPVITAVATTGRRTRSRSIGAALVAGIATFLVVGVAVTELAFAWIEFSLFVGVPVGLVAGAFVAAGVYLGLADDAPERRRRVALAVAGFGAVFLAVLLVAITFDLGVVTSFVLGAVLGLLAAAVIRLRGTGTAPARAG